MRRPKPKETLPIVRDAAITKLTDKKNLQKKFYKHFKKYNKDIVDSTPNELRIGMTPDEALFLSEYIKDWDLVQAYKRTRLPYNKRSKEDLHRRINELISSPSLAYGIQEAANQMIQRTLLTQDRTLNALGRIAFFDPKDCFDENGKLIEIINMPQRARSAVSEITRKNIWGKNSEGRAGIVGETVKIKFYDKLKAQRTILQEISKRVGPDVLINVNNNVNSNNTTNTTNNTINNIDVSKLSNDELKVLSKLIPAQEDDEFNVGILENLSNLSEIEESSINELDDSGVIDIETEEDLEEDYEEGE